VSSAVITIVSGRHRHLRAQRASLRAGDIRPDLHVVVALGDPAVAALLADDHGDPTAMPTVCVYVPGDPLGLPLAAGRNAGAARAIAAGVDLLVFLDVDCLASPELVERYANAARQRPDAVLSGPVTYLPPGPPGGWLLTELRAHRAPHPARPDPPVGELVEADPDLFWSLSFAVTRATWQRIGGFDTGYVGYGAEDTDFARTAADHGVAVLWVGGADAFHQHHPTSTPPIQHVDAVLRNGARYAKTWGTWPMTGWLTEFERLGLAHHDGTTWRRSAPVRVATVPAAHPYLDAVRPCASTVFDAGRAPSWQPDPLLGPDALRAARSDIDVMHVHFGYDHLDEPELDRWLLALHELDLPLVVTVHDLRNPHHLQPDRHDAHLRALLGVARDVITLTDGAAAEIMTRFGRRAQVLAHPTLLDTDQVAHADLDDGPPTVLVPLKSLRRNVCNPAAIVAAVVEGADASGAQVCVYVHPQVVDDAVLEPVRRLADAGRLELAVHERLSDSELVQRLTNARVLVLPYRFGTHSGWVELAHDVGTRALVPSCGYYAQQWSDVVEYANDELHGLDADSLRDAVIRAVRQPRPQPAEQDARRAARDQIRAVHEVIYRRALRTAPARRLARPASAVQT
jgi:N-terminal domain of galactosyltransferase